MARKRKERKDGRICVQFRYEGKRYSAYGETSKEAEKNAALMRSQLIAGTYESARDKKRREQQEREAVILSPRMPSFEEYAHEWIDYKKKVKKIKDASIRTYNLHLNLMFNTVIDSRRFGDLPLDQIRRKDIRDLQSELSKKVYSATVNKSIGLARTIFRHAIDDDIVLKNPANNIEAVRHTEERAADSYHRALTREETNKFFKAAKKKNSRYYNLYTFLLHSGLRIGEAGALYKSDIDAAGIMVSRTITRSEDEDYLVGVDAKTEAGRRFVPLDPDARAAIRDQLDINAAFHSGNILQMRELIFTAARGGILNVSTVDKEIAKICEKAGIEKFTAHAFRDTFATRAAESGMEPKQLQSIMGHSNISITMNYYVHADKGRKIEQLLAVNFT